ncbi:MAG: hypothetical protein PHW03_02835 [Eubacteriales bacterium]|nr:hypothetical protein [Eubacteriales bacterium]
MNYKELLHTGTVISCRIENEFINHAVIYREDDQIWICQNKMCGADNAKQNFGKKYSWQTNIINPSDDNVTDIIIKSPAKGKSKGSSVVEVSYIIDGIVYTKNGVEGNTIKDIQSTIDQYDKDIKEKLTDLNCLREARAGAKKMLDNHAKFAARGWMLKDSPLKKRA